MRMDLKAVTTYNELHHQRELKQAELEKLDLKIHVVNQIHKFMDEVVKIQGQTCADACKIVYINIRDHHFYPEGWDENSKHELISVYVSDKQYSEIPTIQFSFSGVPYVWVEYSRQTRLARFSFQDWTR